MKKQIKPRIERNTEHFRALGLPAGESRIEVIREAARSRAKQLSGRAHPSTVDLHRAKIAVAAYRLLDPRGRTELYERVQLSCPLDQADQLPPLPPAISSINRQIECVTGKSESSSADKMLPIRMMDGVVMEQAIVQSSEEETESDSEGDLTIAERRNVVSLLRELEDATATPWKPIGWIRSKLGI
jgi:hypothetical protein